MLQVQDHSFRSSCGIMVNNGSFPPPSIPLYAAGAPTTPPHQPPQHSYAPPYGGYAGTPPPPYAVYGMSYSSQLNSGYPAAPPPPFAVYGTSYLQVTSGCPTSPAPYMYQAHAGTPAPGAGFPLQYDHQQVDSGYPAPPAPYTYQVHAGTPASGAGFPLRFEAPPLPYPLYQPNPGATGVDFPPPGGYAPPPQQSLFQALCVPLISHSVGGATNSIVSSIVE